jgi:hypothetical protein
MDVPSKCTIVRAIGRMAYRPKTIMESVIGIEVTLSAMLKTHKRKTVFHDRKASYRNP